jgi:chromosome segregation ATPase
MNDRTDGDRLTRVEVMVESLADTTKSILTKLDKHADKMSLSDGWGDKINDMAGDLRTLRHDFKNFEQVTQNIPVILEKEKEKIQENSKSIVAIDARLSAIEANYATFKSEITSWRSEMIGKSVAYKNVSGWVQWLVQLAGGGFVVLLLSYLQNKFGLTIGGE